jgi:hypothetical protein
MFNSTTIDSGRAIMFGYVGIAVGDILIGLVSQYFKSRKKALLLFYGFTLKPSGGINQYQNKLSVDTTNVSLILRQRNFQILGDMRIVNKTNMILFQAGFVGNQKVIFSNENNSSVVNNFSFNGRNAVYANVTFVWFLNKKPRNKNESKTMNANEPIYDDDLIDNAL